MPPSHATGPTDPPLLEETIGAVLRRVAAAQGDREALVARHQGVRLSYAELDAESDRLARALLALGRRAGRPDRDLGAELRRVGADPVRHRPDRRGAGERQPGLPDDGAALRARPVGLPGADRGARVQDVGLRRDGRRGPAGAARADRRVLARRRGVGRAARSRRRGGGRRAGGARGRALPGRPDQHPVHERHDRRPEGRDPLAPQHPQQRLPRRRRLRLRAGGPRLHPGALLPLLRHGHGQPRRGSPRRVHGHPRGGVRAGGDARRDRRGALHVALRRADDVHRRARASRPSRTTTCPRCGRGSWPARRARSR